MDIRSHLPQRSYTRFIGQAAILFASSALFHLAVAIGRGWDWAGAVSFRKPVTFAASFALLAAAVWWILDRLPERKRLGWALSLAFVLGSVVETALITMQSWRGQASHFNVAAEFDASVFSAMGLTIAVVSVALTAIAVWTFVEGPRDRATRLAARAGLVMVVLGLGLGLPLIAAGMSFVEQTGMVPESLTIGRSGVAKFPHAVAFHGVQFLILLTIAGQKRHSSARLAMVRLGVVSYSLVLAWATIHTNRGLAPLDPSGYELGLLAGAGASLLAALAVGRGKFARHGDTLPA